VQIIHQFQHRGINKLSPELSLLRSSYTADIIKPAKMVRGLFRVALSGTAKQKKSPVLPLEARKQIFLYVQ
jgi:hypothetical protein